VAGDGVSSGVGKRLDAELDESCLDKTGREAEMASFWDAALDWVALGSGEGWRAVAGVAASKTEGGIAENESSYIWLLLGFSILAFGSSLPGVAASRISGAMLENESSAREFLRDCSRDRCVFRPGVAASRISGGMLEKVSSIREL